jgi:hypothetical protein
VKRRITIRHLLAALAWLGLILAPLATSAAAMTSMDVAAAASEAASMDMPGGMPCCPESQKKPDCAKDCASMAMCAVKLLSGMAGTGIATPFSISTLLAPADAAKLSGLAQAPPPRPPKT